MPYAKAILLLCAVFLTGCVPANRADYLPVTDQVFLVPAESIVTAAPGTVILTDGPGGRVELDRMTLPYKGVVLSEGYFLLLVRMAGEKVAP